MLRSILTPAWILPSGVPTFGTLMGEAAAFLDYLHDAHCTAWILFALVQQRSLIALGRNHQVIEVVLPSVLLEKLKVRLELLHLLGRGRIFDPLGVLQVAAK